MARLAILAFLFALPLPSTAAKESKPPITVQNSYQYTSEPLNQALNSFSVRQLDSPMPFRTLLLNGSVDVVAAPLSADVIDGIRKKHAYAIVADRGLSTPERPLFQVVLRKGAAIGDKNPFRVAVRDPRRSPDYLFFEHWLKSEGLDSLQPWVMNLSPQEAIVALRDSAVEAAVLPLPAPDDAFGALGDTITAMKPKAPAPRHEIMVLLFSTGFLQNRRAEAVSLLRAYRGAVKKSSGATERKVDYAPDGSPDLKAIQEQIDAYSRHRQLPPGIKAESLIDRDLIDDAS